MLTAFVAVATVTMAAGAGWTEPASAAAPRLFVVGDSVMLGAAPAIHGAFPGWSVSIEGHQGIFTSDAAELAWSHRNEIGDVAIVGTGYNYPVWDPPLFDAWIDQMMQRLTSAGAHHVIWATLREPPLGNHGVVSVWEKAHIAENYPHANAQLRAAQARWPQLVIADWNAIARDDGLTWDGLHLTPSGASLMADLLADEVGGIGRLAAGTSLTVRVPGGAPAAALNVTVTWPRGAGYVTVWPCDRPRPVASNLDYTRHQTVANLVVTRLSAAGTACVYTSADAHIVVDLEGTFTAASGLVTRNPVRVLDTRNGSEPAALSISRVSLAAAGAPKGARAAVLNITAVAPAGAGYVSAWACDRTPPPTSVLDYAPGQTVAALAVVPLAADGTFCLLTYAPAHLLADVAGFFGGSSSFAAASPRRLLDTRVTHRRLAPGGVIAVALPPATAAATVTVTAVDPAAPGYLTAYPCGTAPPLASTLNYGAGQTVSNLAIVGAGRGGALCVTSYAATDVLVDMAGAVSAAGYQAVVPVRLVDTRDAA
jgi:hypothetical protein